MMLSSMVVSTDSRGTSVLESILSSLHIHVEVETDLGRARKKLASSRIDALIVDSEIEGANGLLDSEASGAENCVPLIICNEANGETEISRRAKFLFRKPISVAQAVRTLSSARNLIVDRRLRYHRHQVDIETSLISGERKFDARILNLSQGGAGLEGNFASNLAQQVQLHFSLPESQRRVELAGKIVWMKEQARAGIRFSEAAQPMQKQLQTWLEQQYFSR
ncbi:MAG TPA: PilZ domain-containing protein [Terriglobales bacterium]|nr:PilZ domain-containing protein [Terriglobales bacterium]